jgi:hypothetical protein
MLAGTPPRASGWRDSLPSLIDRNPSLAPGVDAVLRRATSPHAWEHFESMADFVLAWRAAVGRSPATLEIAGRPATSSHRGGLPRFARACETNPPPSMFFHQTVAPNHRGSFRVRKRIDAP